MGCAGFTGSSGSAGEEQAGCWGGLSRGPGREGPGAPLAAAAGERGDKAAPAALGGAGAVLPGPPARDSAPNTETKNPQLPWSPLLQPCPCFCCFVGARGAAAGWDWARPARPGE